MDKHLRMAEHLAIRGLDDALVAPESPYLAGLPGTYEAEPFPGFASSREAALRRVECLTQAHAAARAAAEAALAALPRGGAQEERRVLRKRLERLGEAPSAMAANDEESWAAQGECATAAHMRCECNASLYPLWRSSGADAGARGPARDPTHLILLVAVPATTGQPRVQGGRGVCCVVL